MACSPPPDPGGTFQLAMPLETLGVVIGVSVAARDIKAVLPRLQLALNMAPYFLCPLCYLLTNMSFPLAHKQFGE